MKDRTLPGYCNSLEASVAFRYCLWDSIPFGTHTQVVTCIFHIATCKRNSVVKYTQQPSLPVASHLSFSLYWKMAKRWPWRNGFNWKHPEVADGEPFIMTVCLLIYSDLTEQSLTLDGVCTQQFANHFPPKTFLTKDKGEAKLEITLDGQGGFVLLLTIFWATAWCDRYYVPVLLTQWSNDKKLLKVKTCWHSGRWFYFI